MRNKVLLFGSSRVFKGQFRKTVEDCGFDASSEKDKKAACGDLEDLFIFEVKKKGEARALKERRSSNPFFVFTAIDLQDELPALKETGLMGVITKDTSPEDIAFHLNKALFYNKMLKRNPRVPVNIPVELRFQSKTIRSNASLLSREGMFIITLNPLPVNAACELCFSLPDIEKRFSTKVKVLYNIAINKDLNIIANPRDPFKRLVAHPGMAVFFPDLSDGDKELIDGYIRTLE